MFRRTNNNKFNFDRHLISFLQETPFFAELSRHIKKVPTEDIPTMAVAYDPTTEDIQLGFNPKFCEGLGNWMMRGVIIHEFYHLVFGHLNTRRKTPPLLWNIATDCAINSLIMDGAKNGPPGGFVPSPGDAPLPTCGIIPGEWPTNEGGAPMNEEEKKAATIAAIIAGLPKLKSSEFYYHKILEEAQDMMEKGKGDKEGEGTPGGSGGLTIEDILGKGGIDSMDDHSFWDEVPADKRDLVEGKIRDIIDKAVRHADSSPNGWGNIPADLAADIRKSVSNIINWRRVLRQFTGSLVRGARRTSIRRINKRYPYIHPGVTKGYKAKLLVAIDQSGSVDDGMLELFFAELRSLNKNIEIDILPFDCHADIKDVYTWRRGQMPAAKRTKMGGTDFNAPTAVANDPRNRGRWDGLLIMTDGECSAPGPSRLRRGWVIGKGQKLHFDTTEIVIRCDNDYVPAGAWR